MMERYLIGPLGRLMAVEVPPGGYDNTGDEVAAFHQGLSGRATKDVFGYKRTWSIPLQGLDDNALSWFRMVHEGAVGPPYLVDERERNRLSATVSTTGSIVRAGEGFSPPTYAFANHSNDLLSCTTTQGVQWSPAPAKALTWLGGNSIIADTPIPVLTGETLVFSVYAAVGEPTLEVIPYDRALVAGVPVADSIAQAETPPRRFMRYTVPAGVAAVKVRISGTSIWSLGWQLEASADPAHVPTPWAMGHHPPRVLVRSMPTRRREFGSYTDGTIQLVEV